MRLISFGLLHYLFSYVYCTGLLFVPRLFSIVKDLLSISIVHSFDIFPSFNSLARDFSSRLIAPFVVPLFKIFTSPFPFNSLLISQSQDH